MGDKYLVGIRDRTRWRQNIEKTRRRVDNWRGVYLQQRVQYYGPTRKLTSAGGACKRSSTMDTGQNMPYY